MKKISLSLFLAGTLALAGCGSREIKPIGWYDFNKDGCPDAITTSVFLGGDHEQLGIIDGNTIRPNPRFHDLPGRLSFYDSSSGFSTQDYKKVQSSGRFIPLQNSPLLPIARKGVERSAVIENYDTTNNNFNLHLYTSVDVEPASKDETFKGISYSKWAF